MIPRYSNPVIEQLWSDEWTYGTWREIEIEVAEMQDEMDLIPWGRAQAATAHLAGIEFTPEVIAEIKEIERTTRHDVAAFLQFIRRDAGDAAPWIHFGLTSSDLVDTTQAIRMRTVRYLFDGDALPRLSRKLVDWATMHRMVTGRTHGQPAEPLSVGARAAHWQSNVRTAAGTFKLHLQQMQHAKLSGPVGTFAHNPPELEREIASRLELMPEGAGASQISPRARLALVASSAAALAASCAKIATDLRLMHLLGEIEWDPTVGQVGSSAMAHKNNPIVAEQVCGMARMVAGYAQMLQPLDLWLERDISNSSVERVAVPDMLHVLHRVVTLTTYALETARFTDKTRAGLEENAKELLTHRTTLDAIRDGMGYDEARAFALGHDPESYDFEDDARWFMRNYPTGQ